MEKNEILITYGDDIAAMAIRLAQEADLAGLIGDKTKRIGLKPNLVNATPASNGATTHPEIAEGLITYLQRHGFNNLVILEGAWLGASTANTFSVCGYKELSSKTGVPLFDTKADKTKLCECKGMKIEICESALALDCMINLPVMKGHCQTKLTCALKNNKGIIPDKEKRRFHTIGLDTPIAHLNTGVRNDFIVVDNICGDLDFEEGGNPLYSGRMFAARDPVLCDTWAAVQMGLHPKDIPYIGIAEKLGVGSANLSAAIIRELNTAHADAVTAPTGKVKRYASYIDEHNSCSACYASLIHALSRLDQSTLNRLKDKICIGQGFIGKKGNLGIGKCCADFRFLCRGCPPSGSDILDFLNNKLLQHSP